MNRERQEHGALIITVIRPCVLPAHDCFYVASL